jgi:hypothetical protein
MTRARTNGTDPPPWGPFCSLKGKRHPQPYGKTDKGRERRDERRFKQQQREELVPRDRTYETGWVSMTGGWRK